MAARTAKNGAGTTIPLWDLELDVDDRSHLLALLTAEKEALDKANSPEDFHARCANARLLQALE